MKRILLGILIQLFLVCILAMACSSTEEVADGDATDGDVSDGDEPSDGDVMDGDMVDGDIMDGDMVDGDMDHYHTAEISGLLKAPADAAGHTSYFELYDEEYVPLSSIAISVVGENPPSVIVGAEAHYAFKFEFLSQGTYWIRGAIDITGDGEYIPEDGEYGVTQGQPFVLTPGQVIDDAVILWSPPVDGDMDMDGDMDGDIDGDIDPVEMEQEGGGQFDCPAGTPNELGVGAGCTAGGGECTGDLVCMADFNAGDICTLFGCTGGDCGTDATCMPAGPDNYICAPNRCLPTTCEGGAGNEIGVGKLCTLGGGECAAADGDIDGDADSDAEGEGAVTLTCVLDVDPEGPNMCVILNCTGGECGSGASCSEVETDFFVCLPDECLSSR